MMTTMYQLQDTTIDNVLLRTLLFVTMHGELYPVYTLKQTSSKHQADIIQTYSIYTCTTCALIA